MARTIMFVAAAALAMPAFAQTSFQSDNIAPRVGDKDSNRKICEKVEQIGSRLAAKRVCMTAKEWAEHRGSHQDDLERTQRMQTTVEKFQ